MAMNGDGAPNPPAQAAAGDGLLTAAELAMQLDPNTTANTEHYRALAIELIDRYLGDDADACPVAIKNECMVRITGHGMQSQSAAIIEDTIGPMTRKYPDDRMRSLLKRCGAESLLSAYKTRGAGVIE